MNKRHYTFLALFLLTCLVGLLFDSYSNKVNRLERYSSLIEQELHVHEENITPFFDEKEFIKRQLNRPSNDVKQQELDFDFLEKFSTEHFTIAIFQKDTLVFWTNNLALPFKGLIKDSSPNKQNKLVKLRNGYYELVYQSFKHPGIDDYTICAMIPIKHDYELESEYLNKHFHGNPNIPDNIELVQETTNFPLITKDGKTLCYLEAKEDLVDKTNLGILLSIYLIAFIFLGVFINGLAKIVGRNNMNWHGAAFLILVVFGLRWISIQFGLTDRFSELHLFTPNFQTQFSRSLGDLLVNIILLLWVMIFFHNEFKVTSFEHLTKRTKLALTTLNYFSILIGIIFLTSVFKSLVFDTGLTFDFDNVFNLSRYSLMAIIGAILLLLALFLFSHRMMMSIAKTALTRNERLGALTVATLVAFPIMVLGNLILPNIYLILIAFVFILVFDLFIDSNIINFTWLVIWLIILSAFPSILLFKYNAHKDRLTRFDYAKELSVLRDSIAEKSFIDLKDKISNDQFLINEIQKPFPFKIDEDKIKRQINRYFTTNNYLFYNYSYNVFAFKNTEEPAIKGQSIDYQNYENILTNAEPTVNEDLRFLQNSNTNKNSYLLKVDFPVGANSESTVDFVLEFNRQRREQSKVYTELIVDQQYKNLHDLGKYEYAIYENFEIIDHEGKIYGPVLNVDYQKLPNQRNSKEITVGNRSELIYRAADNKIVMIGREKETLSKAVSLFSYIFGLLVLLIVAFAIVNSVFNILPNTLNFSLINKPSLKNRIQISVISLIVASFVIIGIVTVWFFRNSSEDYHEKRLERKTQSVLSDAKREVQLLMNKVDSSQTIISLLDPKAISKIHRMDVNVYDLNGELVKSSEEDIFNKGIIAKRMGALAFQALSRQGLTEYIQNEERMGDLSYKSAYIALQNDSRQTVAYMGLPYYSKQSKLRSDVTVFMSTLLNVYVFLLLIAGGLAIIVADSITRPLVKIGDKLKEFKLGKRNERLVWKNKDELGDLIGEYNTLIKKLEESADKLAQSEREGAWREMAKQVAHEIKNPLTPMKLSIQYLQHAFQSNPENIDSLLKRVSGTLIEQIDNLAQIATEFSNFAKMPRAENQQIELNKLVYNVYVLFSENNDIDVKLNLPIETLVVFADRNHMMRVLNNLIKNAIQAIPEGRRAKIEVNLYCQDNIATVMVEDNGTGIPEDKQDKVFVPNFTTKSSGTGLGLAISKNIIESVDGKIYFETVIGEGTKFYVELPIVQINEPEKSDPILS